MVQWPPGGLSVHFPPVESGRMPHRAGAAGAPGRCARRRGSFRSSRSIVTVSPFLYGTYNPSVKPFGFASSPYTGEPSPAGDGGSFLREASPAGDGDERPCAAPLPQQGCQQPDAAGEGCAQRKAKPVPQIGPQPAPDAGRHSAAPGRQPVRQRQQLLRRMERRAGTFLRKQKNGLFKGAALRRAHHNSLTGDPLYQNDRLLFSFLSMPRRRENYTGSAD